MPSFDSINYSTRPSKSVQRSLVFHGLKRLSTIIDLEKAVYVGLGSIWFSDFVQAHKILNINDMVSMENNEIGYKRAVFNKPYKTVKVLEGESLDKLPDVFSIKKSYSSRPWVIWLDYDTHLIERIVDEMRWVLANAPQNSIVLFTFSAHAVKQNYGSISDRPQRLRNLLEGFVRDDLSDKECGKDSLPLTLSNLVASYLMTKTLDEARPGGFIEAFRIPYHDSSSMVTVGGVLPENEQTATKIRKIISKSNWEGIVDDIIQIPPMTFREISCLQSMLPSKTNLCRKKILSAGFDLNDEQIESFQKYYKYYPNIAEILL